MGILYEMGKLIFYEIFFCPILFSSTDNFNYTVVVVGATLVLCLAYWFAFARHSYTGPRGRIAAVEAEAAAKKAAQDGSSHGGAAAASGGFAGLTLKVPNQAAQTESTPTSSSSTYGGYGTVATTPASPASHNALSSPTPTAGASASAAPPTPNEATSLTAGNPGTPGGAGSGSHAGQRHGYFQSSS